MSDFQTVLIQDEKLANISKEVVFGVNSGYDTVSVQRYQAQSKSVNNVIFNLSVPSQSICMDRRVMVKSTIRGQMDWTNTTATDYVPTQSNTIMRSFPFNNLISTASVMINNSNITTDASNLIPALQGFLNKRELAMLNSTTPTSDDYYFNYEQEVGTSTDNFSVNTTSFGDEEPRRLFNFTLGTPTATSCTWTAEVYEPLLCASPFTFSEKNSGSAMMYGLQTVGINLSLGDANRFLSVHKNTNYSGLVNKLIAIDTCELIVKYYSPHASFYAENQLSTKNALSYLNYSKYSSPINMTVADGDEFQVVSPNIQFGSVSDMYMVYACRQQTNCYDTNHFMPVKSINLSFNSKNGLMADKGPEELWADCRDANYDVTYHKFAGEMAGGAIKTTGSPVIITPGTSFGLPENLSNGSIAQIQFSATITFKNNTGEVINGGDYMLMITACDSSVLVLDRGNSQISGSGGGMISQETTVNTRKQQGISSAVIEGMVGTGLYSKIKSNLKPYMPLVKNVAKVAVEKACDKTRDYLY